MSFETDRLCFSYRAGTPVLQDLSLAIRPGRLTGLFGPNGSGKSTLLRCLNGALRPQSGTVRFAGEDLARLGAREAARRIAVVSQNTPASLPFTALEVVLFSRYPHDERWRHDSPADHRFALECLARLDVARLAGRPFDQLSGGERQRVVVARSLAQQTPALLWDEAASHLDIRHQLELYQLARGLAAGGRTVVMVCHDLLLAPSCVDDCALLCGGRLHASGPAPDTLTEDNLREVFGRPLRIEWPDRRSVRASWR